MKMIGLSVSACIREIAAGHVDEKDVDMIIGRTAANNQDDWEEVIGRYKKNFWSRFPQKAEAIIRRLLKKGLIKQPRLEGGRSPNIRNRVFWVKSEDDIVWFQ